MSDQELKTWIPKMGDRLALKQFCIFCKKQEECVPDKKKGLMDTLRKKLKLKTNKRPKLQNSSPDESEEEILPQLGRKEKLMGNKNALKAKRKIELGWQHNDGKGYVEVRTKQGGGTRKFSVSKDAVKNDILEEAKARFFPDGLSTKGRIENFDLDIRKNYQGDLIEENVTVEEYYKLTGFALLRFYMFSTTKEPDGDNVAKSHAEDNQLAINVEENDLPTEETHDTEEEAPKEEPEVQAQAMYIPDQDTNLTCLSDWNATFPDIGSVCSTGDSSVLSEVIISGGDLFSHPEALDDTIPNTVTSVILNRGHVLEQLEDFFMSNDIDIRSTRLHVQMVLPSGETEVAEDSGGVLRDSLSEYWESFYLRRTIGNRLKVPALTHAVDGKRWEAVGKIILIGYYYEKYFPNQLSAAFLEYTAKGDIINPDDLLQDFLQYLPDTDSKTVASSLEDFDATDQDDLLDFLDDYGVKTKPNQKNIREIIIDLAHNQIIQKPTYIADHMRPHIMALLPLMDKTFSELNNLLTPSYKSVWASIKFNGQSDVANILKSYLKELSRDMLQRFLRFCTGK